MKMLVARSLRFGAAVLHRVAAFFNEAAYLIENGRQGEVDVVVSVPLRIKFAERRHLIRDQKLDAGQSGDRRAPIDLGKIEGELDEGLVHQADRPADADSGVVHEAYLAWLKFVENKPGWEFLRRRARSVA